MRIHHLRLENYRGVDFLEIDFPADGVTIIEGDNEVGKSSIPEAIDLLLTERDDANKRSVKAVKPVHQDVGTVVEIELSSGRYHFRYRKRWHRERETSLEILTPAKSQLTGREAHDRVRAILEETLDEGLWRALRLRQGTTIEQASFAGGSLGRALDLAAGGTASGGNEDDLWGRITTEYERYWTPTGQMKAERKEAATAVAESVERVADLEEVLRSLEDDAKKVARLTEHDQTLAQKQAANNHELAGLLAQSDAISAQRNEVDRLGAQRDTAQANLRLAQAENERRAELVRRLHDANETVVSNNAQITAAVPTQAQAAQQLADVERDVTAAQATLAEAETAHRRAVADRDYRRQQIETDQLSERHQRVVAAREDQAAARATVETSLVDDDLVQRIETAHLERATAEAAATSGAATVDVEALSAIQIEIDGQPVALAAGDQHRIEVGGSAQVVLPGTISMVVKAGTGAQDLAERLRRAEADFAAACEQGAVAGLAEARKVALARNDAAGALVRLEKSIAQDLRDLTAELLAQKVDSLTQRVAAYSNGRSAEPPLPADFDAAQALAAQGERARQAAQDHLDRLSRDLTVATENVHRVEQGGVAARARLEQADKAFSEATAALEVARQERNDDTVAEGYMAAERAMGACLEALTIAETSLAAADPGAVEDRRSNAEAVETRLANERHTNETSIRDLRARLHLRGEEGLAGKLDIEKSTLLQRQMEHEQLEGRAVAARVLNDTFATRRAEAQQRYEAPFREHIEQLGRLVFGPTLEIELDADLSIARRTLDGISLDFDQLSIGAQEQLGMISRLACASIVASEGGAPVIFDDALGWSDPGRLAAMAAVIALAGRHGQILVLTCTPERYSDVGNATVIQLPTGSIATAETRR